MFVGCFDETDDRSLMFVDDCDEAGA